MPEPSGEPGTGKIRSHNGEAKMEAGMEAGSETKVDDEGEEEAKPVRGTGNGTRFFRKTEHYRIVIDADGVGHIRITKRVNFRTFLALFRELYPEIRKKPGAKPRIIIHLSRSLNDEMSGNLKEFLAFCSACIDGSFEVSVVE